MSLTIDSRWDSRQDYCTTVNHYLDRPGWWDDGFETLETFFRADHSDVQVEDLQLEMVMDALDNTAISNGLKLGESLTALTSKQRVKEHENQSSGNIDKIDVADKETKPLSEERPIVPPFDQNQQSNDLSDASHSSNHMSPPVAPVTTGSAYKQSHRLFSASQADHDTLDKKVAADTRISSLSHELLSDGLDSLFNEELPDDGVKPRDSLTSSAVETPMINNDTTSDFSNNLPDTVVDINTQIDQAPLVSGETDTDNLNGDGSSFSPLQAARSSVVNFELPFNAIRRALSSTPCPVSSQHKNEMHVSQPQASSTPRTGLESSTTIDLPAEPHSTGQAALPENSQLDTSSLITNITSAQARSLDVREKKLTIYDETEANEIHKSSSSVKSGGTSYKVAYTSPSVLPNPYSTDTLQLGHGHSQAATEPPGSKATISKEVVVPSTIDVQQDKQSHTTTLSGKLEIPEIVPRAIDEADTMDLDDPHKIFIDPIGKLQPYYTYSDYVQHDDHSSRQNEVPAESGAIQHLSHKVTPQPAPLTHQAHVGPLRDLFTAATYGLDQQTIISSPVTSPFKLRSRKNMYTSTPGSPTRRKLFHNSAVVSGQPAVNIAELFDQATTSDTKAKENEPHKKSGKRKAQASAHANEPLHKKRSLDANDTDNAVTESSATEDEEEGSVANTLPINPKVKTPTKSTTKGKAPTRKDPTSPDELSLPESPARRSFFSLLKPKKQKPIATKASTKTSTTAKTASEKFNKRPRAGRTGTAADVIKARRAVGSREFAGMFNSPPRKASEKILAEVKGRLRSSTPRVGSEVPPTTSSSLRIGGGGCRGKKVGAAPAATEVNEGGQEEDVETSHNVQGNGRHEAKEVVMEESIPDLDEPSNANEEDENNDDEIHFNTNNVNTPRPLTQSQRRIRPKGSHPIASSELLSLGSIPVLGSRRTATPVPPILPSTTKPSGTGKTRSGYAAATSTSRVKATALTKTASTRTAPTKSSSTGSSRSTRAEVAKEIPTRLSSTSSTKSTSLRSGMVKTNMFNLSNKSTGKRASKAIQTKRRNKRKSRDNEGEDDDDDGDEDDHTEAGAQEE